MINIKCPYINREVIKVGGFGNRTIAPEIIITCKLNKMQNNQCPEDCEVL
jgi:hypothetical protein